MNASPRELLVATRNGDKLREIADVLAGTPFRLTSLLDHPELPEIEETGETLRENALLKARTAAQALGVAALADDTGLEVRALDGAPGVRSSRYAGERATYEENWRKLLAALAGVPVGGRGARFVCVAAFVDPGGGEEIVVEGEVLGRIAAEPRGSGGFGYDPVFLIPELGQTFAELPLAEKQRLSHRGRAFRAMRAALAARYRLR